MAAIPPITAQAVNCRWMHRPTPAPLSKAFAGAGAAMDLPPNDDFNGDSQEGLGLYDLTQKNAERWNAYRAFLAPVQSRPNLAAMTGTDVQSLAIEGRRVIGVNVVRDRQVARIGLRAGGDRVCRNDRITAPSACLRKLAMRVNSGLWG